MTEDTEPKTGYEAAKAKADALKADTQAKEQQAEVEKEKAVEELNQLAVISNNESLAAKYKKSAEVGAANLGSSLPLLKIYAPGRTKEVLADGSRPSDGFFFYKPTGEQFESIECHILTISRGFKAPGMAGGDKDEVFNQLMAGIMIEKGELVRPFIMYMTGKKLQPMWDFGKEASKYTKAKPVPYPLFSLFVRLSTKEEANDWGTSYIPVFEIAKVDDNQPKVVLDEVEFDYLKSNVEVLESTFENIIDRKSSEEQAESGGEPTPF